MKAARRDRDSLARDADKLKPAPAFGEENLYGGDVDAQLNLNTGPTVREYLFGGVGWYREQTFFRQVSFAIG